MLWDSSLQTDKKWDHNHPDIVFVGKQNKNCLIIDIACPSDRRVNTKQKKKINKYLDQLRTLEDEEYKSCPCCYWSTGYHSEETGGPPEKHKIAGIQLASL